MRAVVTREHGGLDRLRIEEIPRPAPGPGEALVRVRAAALNRMDLWMRSGPPEGPGLRGVDLPLIPGGDVAGVVEELGPVAGPTTGSPDPTREADPDPSGRIEAGTPVVVYPGLFCGSCRQCRRGEQSLCRDYGVLGEGRAGGFADYLAVPVRNLEPLPDGPGFEAAAAIPVAFTTAWRMLITAGRLREGETVLVLGVGGGVASAALQIALAAGARVLVTSRSAWKVERAVELGARAGLEVGPDGESAFDRWVSEETDGEGADVVVDHLGAATWRRSIRSLAPGGRLVVCGATTGDVPDISIRELYQSHRRILGAPLGNREEFRRVVGLVAGGRVEPLVHAALPLEEIAEAHRMLEAGEQLGKIVLRVADS